MAQSVRWLKIRPRATRRRSNGEPAMTPVNRKLLRDLWRIKGQAVAIGTVIAVGVLLLVMQSGLITSLDETRRAYYERYRFAEVFAPLNRAPEQLITASRPFPGSLPPRDG